MVVVGYISAILSVISRMLGSLGKAEYSEVLFKWSGHLIKRCIPIIAAK